MVASGYTGSASSGGGDGLTQEEADALYLPIDADLFTQAEADTLYLAADADLFTQAEADALYLASDTDLFTQDEADARYLPLANAVVSDSTLTVKKSDNSAGIRLRSTGGAVDLDKMNGDIVVSSFAGPQFAGTQTGLQRWRDNGTTLAGLTEFGDTVYGGQQAIDAADGVAKLGAKNSLANLRFAGYQAAAGAPSSGTWTTGDIVLDSAGILHRCTAGGTPGTWTSGTATVAHGYLSSGDLTAAADADWTVVSGLTMPIAAAVGDEVAVTINCLMDINGGTDFYDLVVIVDGAIVRYAGTGTGSPTAAGEGDPALYPDVDVRFRGTTSSMAFTVTSGDLDDGQVVFALAHKGAGSSKVLASTNYPFRWTARNDH